MVYPHIIRIFPTKMLFEGIPHVQTHPHPALPQISRLHVEHRRAAIVAKS